MTLIAYHGFRDGLDPVFVTDIVISIPAEEGKEISLPSGARPAPDGPRTVNRLQQKLALIGPNLVVAFAGSAIEAAVLCRELAELGSIPPKEFLDIVSAKTKSLTDDKEFSDLAAFASCLSVVDKVTSAGHFQLLVPKGEPASCQNAALEEVVAHGSGAASYIHFASGMHMQERGQSGVLLPSIFVNICKTMFTVARFLDHEMTSGRGNLDEYWGGAFEVTVFVDGSFQKLQNFVYLLVDFDIGDEKRIIDVKRLMKLEYIGEHLFIRSVELKRDGEFLMIVNDETHHVAPVRPSKAPPTPQIRFDAYDWLCVFGSKNIPNESRQTVVLLAPTFERLSATGAPTIHPPNIFREMGERMEIWCLPAFYQRLNELIWSAEEDRSLMAGSIWAPTEEESRLMMARDHLQLLREVRAGSVAVLLDLRDKQASRIWAASPESSDFASPIISVGITPDSIEQYLPGATSILATSIPSGWLRFAVVAAGGIDWFVAHRNADGSLEMP